MYNLLHKGIAVHRFTSGKRLKMEIDKLVKGGIIEKVKGKPTYISNTPPKKNPDYIRLCIDMREANKDVQSERYILPTLDELIHDLNGSTVFNNLISGYHQFELHPDYGYITFSTRWNFPVKTLEYRQPQRYSRILSVRRY